MPTSGTAAIDLINDLCWHDSVLHEIRLIRTSSRDEVMLIIDLLDSDEAWDSTRVHITLQDCRAVEANMHWGVMCMSSGEMITYGVAQKPGEKYSSRLERIPDEHRQKFFQFELELASTGSTLVAICSSIEIERHGDSSSHQAPVPIPIS